jgi:ClpP class serine protease
MQREDMSIEDFFEEAGISDELAEVVTRFVDDPDSFYGLTEDDQQRLESELDAVFERFAFA